MPAPADHPLLNQRSQRATSSAIRDLLEHAQRPGMISLAGGLPDPALFPTAELADLARAAILDDDGAALQYGLTAGLMALREHIVATTPAATATNEVVITTGSQQGLHLLANVLLDEGDTVVVADPEYLGATQAFTAAGAELAAFPTDANGFVVDELAGALANGLRPKFAYLVPHFHNPSGSTMSADRRHQILDLATTYGFLVIFDDPYRDLFLGDAPPDDPSAHPHAVHLRSTSKTLAPGLRVGWMVGPSWLTTAIERAKQAADLHTSTVAQTIAAGALQADWFPAHLDTLRDAARTKRDALCMALTSAFGDNISFVQPAGGMFVWAALTGVGSTSDLLPRALDKGVAFVPGAAFAVRRDLSTHLRLSWATATPDELHEGVARLARSVAS